jgi:4-amino-4-deoxy-L-arabinose transferase-like glycosyltransferase
MRDERTETRRFVGVAAAIAAFGVFYVVFARAALHAFPFSGDEYSYLLQAELFARGMLHAPTPVHAELLRVDHVILAPWVCSKYPPGSSALLALGVKAGAPWLVTPVEGVVSLVAMAFAARRLLAPREALLAVCLLGAAPLFAFQAASFFSHTAATMWLAVAFALAVGWTLEGGAWRMLAAGACIGCAFLTRPLDALLFGAALLSLRAVRPVVLAAAAAAPFAALLLAYQDAQFGSPFTDGYTAYEPTFRAIYGAHTAGAPLSLANLVDPEQLWHHLDIVRSFLVDWTVPGAALLAMLGWAVLARDDEARRARALAATIALLFAVSLFVTIGGTDDGARPRYLSIALVPVAWLGARGWTSARAALDERLPRALVRCVGVAVWAIPVIQLGAFVVQRTPELWEREGLFQAVAKENARGVVVVRAEYPTRYARNGPFFDRDVLFVSAPAEMSSLDVGKAFPGRDVWEAHEGKTWSLEKKSEPR